MALSRRKILFALSAFVAVVAFRLSNNPKVKIAISMMGWDGIFNVAVENIASRVLGLPQTEARIAYHELIDSLISFDTRYLSPRRQPLQTKDEVAEGYRLGLALLSIGTDFYMEQDPAHPEFKELVTPSRKIMGDNPDAMYYYAPIAPEFEYIVQGRRISEVYMSLNVYGGMTGGGFASSVDADLNFRNIAFQEDGCYKVIISSRPQPVGDLHPNWLQVTKSASSVVTRHYFENMVSAAINPNISVNITIGTIQTQPPPSNPLSDTEVAARLRAVKQFVHEHSTGMPPQDPAKAPSWFSMTLNTIGKPALWVSDSDGGGMGNIDVGYAAGYFKFEKGDTLLMRGRLPRCVFANVVLWNRLLQTLDYRSRPISLNRKQMKSLQGGLEGEYKIVVSGFDPKLSGIDWLDTGDRKGGIIFWRFVLPEGEMVKPNTKLIPAGTPPEAWTWPEAM